jgi:hypothetical protein
LWIVAVVVGLVILIVLVLWIPLEIALQADFEGKPRFRLRLLWLFGLVSRDITGKKKKAAEKKAAVTGGKKRWWADARTAYRVLRTRGLLRHIKEFIKGVFRCFWFREIAADFTIGLGNPADTGLMFAVIGPATAFLGSSRFHRIRIEPYFGDNAVFRGHSHGTARLRPIRLVPPFVKLAFSLPAMRAIWTLTRRRWQRKK